MKILLPLDLNLDVGLNTIYSTGYLAMISLRPYLSKMNNNDKLGTLTKYR